MTPSVRRKSYQTGSSLGCSCQSFNTRQGKPVGVFRFAPAAVQFSCRLHLIDFPAVPVAVGTPVHVIYSDIKHTVQNQGISAPLFKPVINRLLIGTWDHRGPPFWRKKSAERTLAHLPLHD